MDYISKKIYSKHKLDIFEDKRTQMEVYEQVVKARKTLSSSKSADIIVEYLTDELSFDYILSREQFETIAQPVLEKVSLLIQNVKDFLIKTSKYNIILLELVDALSHVELAGEGSRIPAINGIVKTYLNVEISKTMLIDECISKGCCFYVIILLVK